MSVPERTIKLAYPIRSVPRYGYGAPQHPILFDIINRNRAAYEVTLTQLGSFKEQFLAIPSRHRVDSSDPCWINPFLPGLDAVALYGLLALRKPKRYIEIGSGHSTKFARRAIADHALPTHITSIDPKPRAEIDSLCDRVIRKPLEDADLAIFDELDAGDVVFMDGSHQCLMNSDVTVFFLDVLPRLRTGTLIQVHDICLPDDYPPDWSERHYSEQYLLAVHLLAKRENAKIIQPNAFIYGDPKLNAILATLWSNPKMKEVERHGGSFWFEV